MEEEVQEAQMLAELDAEFRSLKAYLDRHSVRDEEYEALVRPIEKTVKNLQRRWKIAWILKALFRAALAIAVLVALFQVSWFYKIVSVLGRACLLQLLPWWDWTRIYYADCILTNPFYQRRCVSEDDCKMCEPIKILERLKDLSPRVSWNSYLLNDVPFIVLDAMDDWVVMNTDDFWFDNITEIYLSEDHEKTEPCELFSNLPVRSNNLQKLLKIIHEPNVRNWFAHWENCDKKAAKALRQFYKRPYFMPSIVDLSDSNFVLMSSDYFSKHYNDLDFSTELLWIAQIRGWSRFRITPRYPCIHVCSPLEDFLKEGQMVVVTGFMWEFEYIPGEGTDNLAIAVGGDWS